MVEPPKIPPDRPDPGDSSAALAAAGRGDRALLDRLIVRHLPELRAFVRLRIDPLLRAQESSSDLVQSVCAEVLAHPSRFEFRGEPQFKNWLYGSVLHEIAAHRERLLTLKRKPPGPQLTNTEALLSAVYTTRFDPGEQAANRELAGLLERAFDVLTNEQREVLTLHRIVGLPHAEIASQLGKSEDATRQLLHRAMAALAVAMRSCG